MEGDPDIFRTVTIIRIQSVSRPFNAPGVARMAVTTLARAEAMGLLSGERVIQRLDLEAFRRVVGRIARAGIGPGLLPDLESPRGCEPKRLADLLQKLNEALDESPTPQYEWSKLADLFGIDVLARLVGTSGSSLRRYKAQSRGTPDDVAARLHFLAMLVSDLAGAYNDVGIRRWFHRKRSLLGERSPAEILAGEWRPDAPGPTQVRQLAHSLAATPAT